MEIRDLVVRDLVTVGPTRGDREAAVRLDLPLGEVLPALAERLGA